MAKDRFSAIDGKSIEPSRVGTRSNPAGEGHYESLDTEVLNNDRVFVPEGVTVQSVLDSLEVQEFPGTAWDKVTEKVLLPGGVIEESLLLENPGGTIEGIGAGTYVQGHDSHGFEIDQGHETQVQDMSLATTADNSDSLHITDANGTHAQDFRFKNLVIEENTRYGIYAEEANRIFFDQIYFRHGEEAGFYGNNLRRSEGTLIASPHPKIDDFVVLDGGSSHNQLHVIWDTGDTDDLLAVDIRSGNHNQIWVDCDSRRSSDTGHQAVRINDERNRVWCQAHDVQTGIEITSEASRNWAEIQYNNYGDDESVTVAEINGARNRVGIMCLTNIDGDLVTVDSWENSLYGMIRGVGDGDALQITNNRNSFYGVIDGDITIDGNDNNISGVHSGGTLTDNGTGNDTSNLIDAT